MGQGYDNGDSYYSQYPTDDNKYEYRTAGATLIVSAQWIKKEERTSIQKIDNVIPVAPKETASLLEKKCDQLEIITKLATSSFIVSVNITKTLCKIIIDMSLYLYL